MMQLIQRPSTRVYLAVLIALGTFVRFFGIAWSSIWHDEGFTMMLAPHQPLDIIARTARDVHPPLYYLVLHYWILIFGSSETAARGLSAVCLIAAIPLAYDLLRRLYSEPAARVGALMVTLGPFLIRYSQEARMYAMVAFLGLLATYALIRALESKNRWWWLLYAIAIAACLYTHYYSAFIVVAHWLYVAIRKRGLTNRWWWGSNFIALGLYSPWLPVAWSQFTRARSSWIPPITDTTLTNTLFQFTIFSTLDTVPAGIKIVLGVGFLAVIAWFIKTQPRLRQPTWLLLCYLLIGPLLLVILPLKSPIYLDRYFTYAAVAFYCLVGVMLALLPALAKRARMQNLAIGLVLVLFVGGIVSIRVTTHHDMRQTAAIVNGQYRPGDDIVSGEIFTYFDFSYYNRTGKTAKLWAGEGFTGYGESSLLYDRAQEIQIKQLSDLHPKSGYLWMIGKPGWRTYFNQVPDNWQPIGPHYSFTACAAQKFRVLSPRS